MKNLLFVLSFVVMSLATTQMAAAHCEVPCGIYDDQMRIKMIREHITTIEKAMKEIVSMSGEPAANYNQIIRWTMNKEKHAEELQHIVQQYFMTQRVKPADAEDGSPAQPYVEQLTLLHMMLIHAMKAKQTTDLKEVETLRSLTDRFNQAYFEGKQ